MFHTLEIVKRFIRRTSTSTGLRITLNVLDKWYRKRRKASDEFLESMPIRLPADILGLEDRGYLKSGYWADVVAFDPEEILDRATFESPFEHSVGVRHVFVNGRPAIDDGQPTGGLAGRPLRKP